MGIKITCSKCGEFLDLSRIFKYAYCKSCHAQFMRKTRPKHSQLKPDQRKKANARSYANEYVNRGTLVKLRCQRCNAEKAEMHHDDYNKPLEVVWLCRPCHLELHRTEA